MSHISGHMLHKVCSRYITVHSPLCYDCADLVFADIYIFKSTRPGKFLRHYGAELIFSCRLFSLTLCVALTSRKIRNKKRPSLYQLENPYNKHSCLPSIIGIVLLPSLLSSILIHHAAWSIGHGLLLCIQCYCPKDWNWLSMFLLGAQTVFLPLEDTS